MHPRMEYALTGQFFEDEVYSCGEVVRIERSPSQLVDELDDYCDRENVLWWGITEPYTNYPNTTISFYRKGTAPFGNNDWYGVKIDTLTGKTWYKVQDNDFFTLGHSIFEAKANTYDASGTLVGYDLYATSWTAEYAKEYCQGHALPYPFSGLEPSLAENVWIWGVTFSTSNTPVAVKAYRILK